MRLLPWLPMLASLGRLPCAGGDSSCEHEAAQCQRRAGELQGTIWPTCPFRSVLDDTAIPGLLDLERRLRSRGVAARPRLSAGAERALIELADQRALVQAREQRLAALNGGGE